MHPLAESLEHFLFSTFSQWSSTVNQQILSAYGAYRRRQWHPTPVLLPGKSQGRRSLVGCSPWGHKESDTTEQLHFHFSLHALEEKMATRSSVLAWRISGTAEPGGQPSMWLHRVGHDWSDLAAAAAMEPTLGLFFLILFSRCCLRCTWGSCDKRGCSLERTCPPLQTVLLPHLNICPTAEFSA